MQLAASNWQLAAVACAVDDSLCSYAGSYASGVMQPRSAAGFPGMDGQEAAGALWLVGVALWWLALRGLASGCMHVIMQCTVMYGSAVVADRGRLLF